MKLAPILVLLIALMGCAAHDRVAMDRYDKAQDAHYQLYLYGNISEAKQALHQMLTNAEQHRGKFLKYDYGAKWEVCLTYGRLALIAEYEGDQQNAKKFWDAAVEAQLEYQKDERAWARANPGVRVPNQDSDVYERMSPGIIRGRLAALERNKDIAWKRPKQNDRTQQATQPSSGSGPVTAKPPDEAVLATLTNGMTVAQVQKILGIPGRPRENSAYQILEYDFDGLSVWVEMSSSEQKYDFDSLSVWVGLSSPENDMTPRATAIRIHRDGLTVAERENLRQRKWSEWVAAHQGKKNGIPNPAPESTARPSAAPQR